MKSGINIMTVGSTSKPYYSIYCINKGQYSGRANRKARVALQAHPVGL